MIRKHLRFGPAALGSLFVIGLLTVAFAANRTYWLALVLWGLAQGLGIGGHVLTVDGGWTAGFARDF